MTLGEWWNTVVFLPWSEDLWGTGWIVVMGVLVNTCCGLVGTFLIWRRMAMLGDALSHSLLPGIVVAALLTHSLHSWAVFLGAILAGMLASMLIGLLERISPLKADAILGVVFTSMFALGVILVNTMAGDVHLDVECVLYGEIGYIPLFEPLVIAGREMAPVPVVRMGVITLLVIVIITLLYRGWKTLAFDEQMATLLGMPVRFLHYGLMAMLSLVVVSSFEAVGVILVVAMLVFPGVTAGFFLRRLSHLLWAVPFLSVFYALTGFHLAYWMDTTIAGAMVVMASLLFVTCWLLKLGIVAFSRGGNSPPAGEPVAGP